MDEESLNQRIKYLMEYGGVWDDPLSDIRRRVTAALVVAGVSVLVSAVHVAYLLTH